MIRGILFDLGDTLLDFERLDNNEIIRKGSAEAYQRLCEIGCKMPSLSRYRRANVASIRWALIRGKFNHREFNALPLMRKHALRWGAPDDDAFMLELAWLWYKCVLPLSSIEPDLIATLRRIHDAGIKIGVVSNTFIDGRILDRHLELMGLLEHLPVRIYSSAIGIRKPHPVIFYRALAAIQTRPRDTLFVGDILKNDIIGAGRLGMKTALKLRHPNGQPTAPADHVIRQISDLVPIIFPEGAKSVDPGPQIPASHA